MGSYAIETRRLSPLFRNRPVWNSDEAGFPRKGTKSVGVERQYSGTLGRTDNGQVAVFANYASPKGHAFLDRRLFLPAVYLKSQGLLHEEICRSSRISENTLRSYLRQNQEGGVERLKRFDFTKPVRELSDHREELEDYFRKNPPRPTAQAAADIERITGMRRGLTQVRKFLTGMGLKCRELVMTPADADE